MSYVKDETLHNNSLNGKSVAAKDPVAKPA